MKRSAEYYAWVDAKARCNNPRRHGYSNYGGRGITFCQRWADFSVFLADVGRRPSVDHSLQRLDINGNYEPSNVRWLPRTRQNLVRRPVRHVVLDSCSMSLSAAEKLLGLGAGTLRMRLQRGWPVEKALSR